MGSIYTGPQGLSRNPDFSTQKEGKMKKDKKGNPSPKTARGARKPRPQRPFRLEVGKTYENRTGKLVVDIVARLPGGEGIEFEGRIVRGRWGNCGGFWFANGTYHPADLVWREGWRDLVREVSKPSQSRKVRAK